MTNEFELKFQVPPERAEATEAALARGKVHKTRLRARYFDTADEALARAGIVLRIRREGRGWMQTAKGRAAGGFDRLEHNAEISATEAEGLPDPARHAGHPVHDALLQALGNAPLQATFETDVARVARTVAASGSSIEVALDRGQLRAAGRSQPVLELEFELKEGTRGALLELARAWCEQHGLWLDPLSKSQQGQRLLHGEGTPQAVKAAPLDARPRELLGAIVDGTLAQILGNARAIAAGDFDDTHIHQLRVGLRRLRSALRELAPLGAWEGLDPAVADRLHQLFRSLGEHRDRERLLPTLRAEMAHSGFVVPNWSPELPDVAAAVREASVQDALLQLVGLAEQLRAGTGTSGKALRGLADLRLQRLHRRVTRAGRGFVGLPQAERHAVRKRLKRLRYLAELVRPLYRGADVDRYVKALEELQDALGHYQDAAAGRTLFEQHAEQEPAAWFGAGWLAAREDVLAEECQRACRRMAKQAQPFWG